MLREGIISVSYVNGMFLCDCAYADRRVPKEAGFFWSPRFRCWATTSARCAAGLISFADSGAKREILVRLNNAPGFRAPEWICPMAGCSIARHHSH
jgi:hypothetical protein